MVTKRPSAPASPTEMSPGRVTIIQVKQKGRAYPHCCYKHKRKCWVQRLPIAELESEAGIRTALHWTGHFNARSCSFRTVPAVQFSVLYKQRWFKFYLQCEECLHKYKNGWQEHVISTVFAQTFECVCVCEIMWLFQPHWGSSDTWGSGCAEGLVGS